MSETKVLYNGECPICSREIASYERYAERHALALEFEALQAGDLKDWGISPDQAARRLHVLKDGKVYDGLEAFQILWSEMPRFAWLSKLTRKPVVQPLARRIYDYVLAPLLYRLHRWRVSQ